MQRVNKSDTRYHLIFISEIRLQVCRWVSCELGIRNMDALQLEKGKVKRISATQQHKLHIMKHIHVKG